jgi:ABC-2 type transport system permease protein
VNVLGLQTLVRKEVRRFLRVPGQTIASPLVSTVLYFVVFGSALSSRVGEVEGIPYTQFIVPGLVFLGIANNAFLNTSSSLFITKLQGTVVDLLAAPMGAFEILAGFVLGAMVRGLLVGGLTWAVGAWLAGAPLAHPGLTLLLLLLTAYAFAVLGFLAGLWAEKFEQVNFWPTFIMLPLTFLGGVFYSVNTLPGAWRTVSLLNPVVYMVDGARHAMLGRSVFTPWAGPLMLLGLSAAATWLAYALLKRGYKLQQ